jgi:ubiquinone/menaquinone biosynthesis C-methylase UbiE
VPIWEKEMAMATHHNVASGAPGIVLRRAALYDFLVLLFTLGRERAFRERILQLAQIEPGAVVLDVGCGTGSLAIAAKRRVGPTGAVYGIDASPQMLARANRKAAKAGLDVVFKNAPAQALPFADATFNLVLSTLMLHHLPGSARQQCVFEMRRVLKPGGRILAVDFAPPRRKGHGFLARLHRHGHVRLDDIMASFSAAGLTAESAPLGTRKLHFVLAAAPQRTS